MILYNQYLAQKKACKMYSIQDLSLFIKVVNLGNFSNTAKQLNVSQTTISRQIRELEEQLGTRLFLRDGRTFELTKTGQQIYSLLSSELQQFEQLSQLLQSKVETILNRSSTPCGKLRIVLPQLFAYESITKHLPSFIRRYPEIELSVIYDHKVNLVEDGVDFAIISHNPTQLSYRLKHIATFNYKLFCTKSYADKYGVPLLLDDLSQHLIAAYYSVNNPNSNSEPNAKIVIAVNDVSQNEFFIEPSANLAISSPLQNNQLIISNEVICPLTKITMNEISKQHELVQVLPEFTFGKVKFYSIRHPHSNDAAVQAFSEFLEEIINPIDYMY